MSRPQDRQLLERIEQLERAVAVLQAQVTRGLESPKRAAPAAGPVSPPRAPVSVGASPGAITPPFREARTPSAAPAPGPAAPPPAGRSRMLPAHMRHGEYWLNKVGIGLLLFGLAFLFKYSIDQGWLTPTVRVGFGLALGAGLIALGARLHGRRRAFSQVLLGGGIATFYITGFAAYQLLRLVSHPAALTFMTAVTVAAFVLALAEDEAVLSLIGTSGGLGTPFLLYTGAGDLPGLILYTCLVLTGSSAVYLYKGWRGLLWTALGGGWIVLLIAADAAAAGPGAALQSPWALQGGALFAWIAFWALPLVRELLASAHPERWAPPALNRIERWLSREARGLADRHVHLLTVGTPLAVFFYSRHIWNLAESHWGWIAMGGVFAYACAAGVLKRGRGAGGHAYTHGLVAVLLFTIAVTLLLDGDLLFVALTGEAAVLHLYALRRSDRFIAGCAHLFWVALGALLAGRLLTQPVSGTPFLNGAALADLWAVATALGLAFCFRTRAEQRLYVISTQAALVGLLAHQLDGSNLLASLALQAAALHLVALRFGDRAISGTAHLLFALLGAWMADRLHISQIALLIEPSLGRALAAPALVDLWVVAAALACTLLLKRRDERTAYGLSAHIALLFWIWREFVLLPTGQALATVAWGAYAVGLLLFGLRRERRFPRLVGLATLMAVVAKLFGIDLKHLAAIWRVLLFLGFGGLFLLLSYYLRALWKPGKPGVEPEGSG